MVIKKGSQVFLLFKLKLSNGQIIDQTQEMNPATLVIGHKTLPQPFEAILIGMCAGEEKVAHLEPSQGFGLPSSKNIQKVARHRFARTMDLAPGLVVLFMDANNMEVPGIVKSIDERFVEVDFNHPLAGKSLIFEVSILDVKILERQEH